MRICQVIFVAVLASRDSEVHYAGNYEQGQEPDGHGRRPSLASRSGLHEG